MRAGEPPNCIQQQLDHHSPAFTLAVQVHLPPRCDRRAVDRLDDATSAATVRNPGATHEPGEGSPVAKSSSWTSLYLI
jgi:hypothetical protein